VPVLFFRKKYEGGGTFGKKGRKNYEPGLAWFFLPTKSKIGFSLPGKFDFSPNFVYNNIGK
jgi:hypothetical protein